MDAGSRIDLATEPDLAVGVLVIVPSRLEIRANGVAHAVPPRVMQVLVALARARGRTVSRDELAESCWQGRVVGEDALNRVVAKIRDIAAGPAEGGFEIETIKRVGYRIVVTGEPVAAANIENLATPPILMHADAAIVGRWKSAVIMVAVAVLAVVAWQLAHRPSASEPMNEPLVLATTDMETRGLAAMFEGERDRTLVGIDYLRQATEIDPKNARIWGALAMANALSLADANAGGQAAIIMRVREAAAHAQSLDPREGRSIASLISLDPTFGAWTAKDRALQRGLARARPGTAPLIFQRIQFLIATGRIAEALVLANQLNKSSPLIPWIQATRINLLAAAGHPDEAERAADRAGQFWPRQRLIWFTRFYLAAYGGRPDKALKLAAAGGPDDTNPGELALAIAVAKAILSQRPDDADAVMAECRRLAPISQGFAEQAITAAAALGRTDSALGFVALLYKTKLPVGWRGPTEPRIGYQAANERNTAILFLPPTSRLWREPTMARLAEDIGLNAYWKRTRLPDLCRSQPTSLICKVSGIASEDHGSLS